MKQRQVFILILQSGQQEAVMTSKNSSPLVNVLTQISPINSQPRRNLVPLHDVRLHPPHATNDPSCMWQKWIPNLSGLLSAQPRPRTSNHSAGGGEFSAFQNAKCGRSARVVGAGDSAYLGVANGATPDRMLASLRFVTRKSVCAPRVARTLYLRP
jgi:hypothetical protein